MTEKKPLVEKRYALPSHESIKTAAQSRGHEIDDEIAGLLAEDVSYRLRQIMQASCKFMRHGKRRKLTVNDFSNALKHADVASFPGHNSPDPCTFRYIKDADVCAIEDPEISLLDVALQDEPVYSPGQTSVKAHWLVVEDVQKTAVPKPNVAKKVSDDLLMYYDQMSKALLSTDHEVMKAALMDLRTNSKILPVFSYFVNFISVGVTKLSHDLHQLMKILQTVQALVNNESIFMEPRPYLNLLVQAVMYCLTEPLAASINPLNDHWRLREYAARLLAQIITKWTNIGNQFLFKNTQALKDILYSPDKPACSHYGALVALTAFGHQALEKVLLPFLPNYFARRQLLLNSASGNVRIDLSRVDGAVVNAILLLLRHQPQPADSETYHVKMRKLYVEVEENFGEKLSRLPPTNTSMLVRAKKKEPIVKLEPDLRTGEEMLAEFMDMVKQDTMDEAKSELSYRSMDDNDVDSPSYKSDRSDPVSEETFDDNIHLAVKSTVNDPNLGIKLTITKRFKDSEKKLKKRKIKLRTQDVFEKSTFSHYQPFVFNVPRMVKWTSRGPRREFSLDYLPNIETNRFRNLFLTHPKSWTARKRVQRKSNFVHITSGSILIPI